MYLLFQWSYGGKSLARCLGWLCKNSEHSRNIYHALGIVLTTPGRWSFNIHRNNFLPTLQFTKLRHRQVRTLCKDKYKAVKVNSKSRCVLFLGLCPWPLLSLPSTSVFPSHFPCLLTNANQPRRLLTACFVLVEKQCSVKCMTGKSIWKRGHKPPPSHCLPQNEDVLCKDSWNKWIFQGHTSFAFHSGYSNQ